MSFSSNKSFIATASNAVYSSYCTSPYRYGFQNQERDDEIKGAGNSYNYEYRMHDPRLGRFFAIDPLAAQYPYNSPYAFSENVVINAVELEGLEKQVVNEINNSFKDKPELKVVNYYMVIYTNQPINGEATPHDETGQFGHSYVSFVAEYDDGSKERLGVGFYGAPEEEGGPGTFTMGIGAGEIKVEDETRWNVKRWKTVTKEGFGAALDQVKKRAVDKKSEYDDDRTKYDIQKYNCTDFAIEIYNKGGGEQIKIKESNFTFNGYEGKAHSPAELGEYLKKMMNSVKGKTTVVNEDTKGYPSN